MAAKIPNMWLFDPLLTGHVTRRMRSERFSLQNTPLYKNFTYKRPFIVIVAPLSCIVNRQYGIGNSK